MTKVLQRLRQIVALGLCSLPAALAQPAPPSNNTCPQTADALYSRLRSVGLDPTRVYHVRGASIDRAEMHLDFDDGTIAFTEDVCGRITGAVFEGDGEILLRPPDRAERASLALFTGMAILEEQFASGYLRFNDDTATALQPFLTPATDDAEFLQQWTPLGPTLAQTDALRLLVDFSHFLPTASGPEPALKFPHLLHAHLIGKKLGGFEMFWDSTLLEPLWVGQPRMNEGKAYFDIWTSYAPLTNAAETQPIAGDIALEKFKIQATVDPPTRLQASTTVDLHVRHGGQRTVLLELSRYLKLESLEQEGRPLEFIHNQAMEGTELQRKGNDLVAVVFPSLLRDGQELQLVFRYAGDVLSEAGNGLLYVGERGTWYPNFGLNPAQFDLEFRYPANWTLVATGKPIPAAVAASQPTTDPDQMVSRWVSERPIAVAGFNLGQYTRSEARSGDVLVEAYGTKSLEKSFPKPPPEIVEVRPLSPNPQGPTSVVVLPPPPTPSPAHNTQAVADRAAKAVDHFSRWFGPYPYSSLALTQMPGAVSQGWPGLVFLSSQVFLTTEELNDLHHDSLTAILATQILEHETAHQWWGDLVLWSTYRDQWFSEGLANYSSLLVLEQQNPTQFHQVLDKYRSDLLSKTKNGEQMRDAGPVTLGQRLISSHFPGGYEAISYERGTWMFHMLRCMLRDAEATTHSRNGRTDSEEPFFRSLRKLRDRYAGKTITTRQLIEVFEADLPRPLWYQGHRSLDWFLDGWINGTAMPRLRTRGVRTVEKDRGVVVTGTLEQQDAPDALVTAVPVYAVISGRSPVLIGQVLADGAETSFRLNAPVGTRGVVFDPKETVLTTLK